MTHIIVIMILMAAVFTVCSFDVRAASVPSASGQINSPEGAILRKSATTSSERLTVLPDNAGVTIYREVFVTKKSTKSTNRWYYVGVNGKKGYVRADLIDNIRYGAIQGKTKVKIPYRKGAGTKMKSAGKFRKGKKVTVVLKATPVYSTRGSSSKWYKVKAGNKYFYVCSSKIKLSGTKTAAAPAPAPVYNNYISSPAMNMSDAKFEKYMSDQGFPESYKPMLRNLHKAHPNWGFVAYRTGISWSDALAKQTKGGTSLVSGSLPSSYRDGSKQYEKGWYKANSKVVAYYMDPRNFINENCIWMFEDLSYKPAYQTAGVVNAILSSTQLPSCGFTSNIFVEAGAASNVSPVFLASRARQENGGGGAAVNGTKVLGTKVYNPFNIGAYGGSNPLYNGLLYAYEKKWTTQALATTGGATEMAKNYISRGQHTVYYQRFNVRNGAGNVGTHQYMTNITAPYTEALSTKNSYVKYGIVKQSLVFEIPVYTSMPGSTKLP